VPRRRKARCCAPMRRGRYRALRLPSFAAPPEQTPGLRSPPGPASPSMVRSGLGFDSVRGLLGPLATRLLVARAGEVDNRRRDRLLGDGLGRPPRRGLYVRSVNGRTSSWFRGGPSASRSPHRGRRCRQGCPPHRDGRHERRDRRLSSACQTKAPIPRDPSLRR
jgi:hypothetical protein